MNDLQKYVSHRVGRGWAVTSMTDQQAVLTKRKGIGAVGLIGAVVGLFFYIVPGLLILIIAYMARGTETEVVTVQDAKRWAATNRERAAAELKRQLEWDERLQEMSPAKRFFHKHPGLVVLGSLITLAALVLYIS